MKKLLAKIIGATTALAMAIGVGVAVGINKKANRLDADPVTDSITISNSSFTGLGSNSYGSGAERTGSATGVNHSDVISLGGHYITGNNSNTPSGAAANSKIQCQASNATIYNTTALPGRLVSVVLNQSGTARAFSLYGGSSRLMASDNTGTGQTPSGTKITDVATSASMTWNIPANSDYTFFAIKKGSNAGYVDNIVVTYEIDDNPTPKYTVTYDANGGTGTMTDSNSPYSSGATVTVLSNTFTRDGYTFDHWDTQDDDGGTDYNANATFTISTNTTLYAQWVVAGPATYTVTYDANGGTGTMTDSNAYTSGASVTVLDNTFTRNGYAFDHWNTQDDDNGTDYDEGDTFDIAADTTLYAQWSVVKYPCTDENNQITWDLSIATYNTMTDSEATWTSDKASISVVKGTSAHFSIEYCPPEQDHTRFYQNNIMTISPASGYKINSIVFTATTAAYASAFNNGQWTNAAHSLNSTTVTVTPTEKTNDVTIKVGAVTRIAQIVVEYAVYSALDRITLSGTYPTTFDQGDEFSHDGIVVTATYENGSTANVTSLATWSGYNMSGSGNQTVTVSYTEEQVQKTATYTITVTAAPFITPDEPSVSGQVGGNEVLSFSYGNLTNTINVVSGNISVATVSELDYENGDGLVQVNFVGSGTTTLSFKQGETQLSTVDVTVTRTTRSTLTKLLSADMTSAISVTDGYTPLVGSATSKSGYYQDGGTANEDTNYIIVKSNNPLFANQPEKITFTARICGGTARNPLNHNVEVCLIDADDNEIESTKETVTTAVTNTAANYSVDLDYSSSAYGVKLMHMKEASWNVRYYSFDLYYDDTVSIKTIYGNETVNGNDVSVNNVKLRFGAKITTANWTDFVSVHGTITDYGVMFARKAMLDNRSYDSVKEAYEKEQACLFIVRKNSGTAPTPIGSDYIFTAYLSIEESDYANVFCAAPFIVAGGNYYFLDEMRYSVRTLADECYSHGGSALSSDALAVLKGN